MHSAQATPAPDNERYEILDILRGIALIGICVANYPVISLYIFQSPDIVAAMPTAMIDKGWAYFHFAFIDGRFYSLFSLLFGIGFSIMILRLKNSNRNAYGIFYRRLVVLLLFGLAHALLIWEGDILLLYALLGMLLPLFRKVSDKTLLVLFVILVLSPLLFDAAKVISKGNWKLAGPLTSFVVEMDARIGITDENAGRWIVEHDSYSDVLRWLQNGFAWRWMMLIDGNRLPKVLGLFLLGFYVGRKMIYANLEENRSLLRKVQRFTLILGLPASIAFSYFELDNVRLPNTPGLLDTLFYALSVIPMSLFYASTICLLYLKPGWSGRLRLFAPVGRMALTNYIMQSVIGVLIFWGVGFGVGSLGLIWVILIAVTVYLFQILISRAWLKYFRYGPLEWIWRQLTYGKRLPIRKPPVTIQTVK